MSQCCNPVGGHGGRRALPGGLVRIGGNFLLVDRYARSGPTELLITDILKSRPIPVFSSDLEDLETAGKQMAQQLHAVQAGIDGAHPALDECIRWLDATFAQRIVE